MKSLLRIAIVALIAVGVPMLWDNLSFGGYKMTNEIIEKVEAEDTKYTFHSVTKDGDETMEVKLQFTGEGFILSDDEERIVTKDEVEYEEFMELIIEDLKKTRELYKTGTNARVQNGTISFNAAGKTLSDITYRAEVAKDGSYAESYETERAVFPNGKAHEYRLEFEE